jgi:hypothetical protein
MGLRRWRPAALAVKLCLRRPGPSSFARNPLNQCGHCFVVIDSAGQKLAYVYFEEEPGRRSAAKLLATFNLGIRTGSTWDCP